MNKKYYPILPVPYCGEDLNEDAREKAKLETPDKSAKGVLEEPYTLKLVAPSLIHHFPDLIMFLRHDVRKYPRLVVVENGPYPYPFIEVYNIESKLLYEIDVMFKNRAQLNKLMRDYDQLPINSLERLAPPDAPEQSVLRELKRTIKLTGIGQIP